MASCAGAVAKWLLEARVSSTGGETPLARGEQISSAHGVARKLESTSLVVCDQLDLALQIMGDLLKCSRYLLPEWLQLIRASQEDLRSTVTRLRQAKPEAIAAWKAHLTKLVTAAKLLTTASASPLTETRQVVDDFKSMTRERRARLVSLCKSDLDASSAQLETVCQAVTELNSPDVLEHLPQYRDSSKTKWVASTLKALVDSYNELQTALDELGLETTNDGHLGGKDYLTEVEERVEEVNEELRQLARTLARVRLVIDAKETPDVPVAFANRMEGLHKMWRAKGPFEPALITELQGCRDIDEMTVLLTHAMSLYPPIVEAGLTANFVNVDGAIYLAMHDFIGKIG